MRIRTLMLGGSALLTTTLIQPLPVSAHHNTGAMFDLDAEVELSGTVTRYEWKNPHVYFFVAIADDHGESSEWEVEGGPVAFMHRFGWHRRSLIPGDSIRLRGNPSKTGANEVYLVAARKADGTALPASRGPDVGKLFADPDNQGHQANNLAGMWVTVANEAIQNFEDADALPLSAGARTAHAAFDENTMHPGITCTPIPAPMMMAIPDTKRIDVQPDHVRIQSDFDGTERTIHLNKRAGTPSVHGHSLGRFEGPVLHIVTEQFTPVSTGIGFGIPSSAKKRLQERLALTEDRRSLTYSFELTDPENLTEPVTGEVRWSYQPDATLTGLSCDRENAARFTKHIIN